MVSKFFSFLGYAFFIVMFVAFIVLSLNANTDAEHYIRVYEDPLTVKATVTHYEIEEDDDDTDYLSYVSYTVNDKNYKNIQYENKSSSSSLTPVGTTVDLKVSPEDPSKTISSLKTSAFSQIFILPINAIMLSIVWFFIFRRIRRPEQTVDCVPEYEKIRKDVRLCVIGNGFLPAFFLIAVSFIYFHLRFPMISGTWTIVLALISLGLFAFKLKKAISNIKSVENEDFKVTNDVLVEKHIDSDSDSASYVLTYKSGDKTWTTNVSFKVYESKKVGDVVISVYLPNQKRPLIHYYKN